MWVSRERMEAIERRLEWLEKNRVSPEEARFTVYEAIPAFMDTYHMRPYPHAKIPVLAVVQSILDKLGMTLTYVKGQPERVAITDTPAAAERVQEEKK